MRENHGEFRDRDYILTEDGLFFCILGYVHPPQRVTAYLKYAPSSQGEWRRGERRYRRAFQYYTVPSILETLEFLKTNHPAYIYFDPVIDAEFSYVPTTCILMHFKPQTELYRISTSDNSDILQRQAVALSRTLSEASGVPVDAFGVTGSILIGIHTPAKSDIDLTIHGWDNSIRVRNALQGLLGKPHHELRKFSDGELENWCRLKASQYPMTVTEAKALYNRMWNRGFYHKTAFSIHPVRTGEEIPPPYGAIKYRPLGEAQGEVKILEDKDSLFLPATYRVDGNVKFDSRNFEVKEVVSYEGMYTGVFERGETLRVKGLLERAEDSIHNNTYHRLLIGSGKLRGQDYMKPLGKPG